MFTVVQSFAQTGSEIYLFDLKSKKGQVTESRRVFDLCQSQLKHLYAVRNSIVHRGERIGSDTWSLGLATLGLEMILLVSTSN